MMYEPAPPAPAPSLQEILSARVVTAALIGLALALALSFIPSPASALSINKHEVNGQVHEIETVNAGDSGEAYAAALVVKRGVEHAPQAWLIIAPSTSAENWTFIELGGSPGTLAVGDVMGDGNDEVAITHRLEGDLCPGMGPVESIPCGIVRVYDGQALAQGEIEVLHEVRIQPDPHACPPSHYPPGKLDLTDVTGDGHADLAMGQTGRNEDTCGAVRVLLGATLASTSSTTTHDACAVARSEPTEPGSQPSMYGTEIELFTPANDPTHGKLAVGAPQADRDGVRNVGELTVYDIKDACPGAQGMQNPPVITQVQGEERDGVFTYSLAHHHDTLWVSSATRGPLAMFNATTLEEEEPLPIAPQRPVKVTMDMTGDGEPQLMSGPYVHNLDGTLAYHFQPFAHDNFRAAPITGDQMLVSDKFGQRLWALSDLDRPHLVLYATEPADLGNVHPGDRVNVSIAQMFSTIPDPYPLQWHASGANVTAYEDTWIHLVPDEPGTIVVQATLSNTTATYRVPVHAPPGTLAVDGSNQAHPGQTITLKATAPENATVAWEAPDGSPVAGNGTTFQIAYASEGTYTITATITPEQGNKTVLEHVLTVQKPTLAINAPGSILQGERLNLTVEDAPEEASLHWRIDHDVIGPLNLEGRAVRLPTAGFGPLNVIVQAIDEEGETMGTGYATVRVENVPPRIGSLSIDSALTHRLAGQITAEDPGGDALEIRWFLEGEPVDEGTRFSAGGLEEGLANVTVIVTDEGGLSSSVTRPVTIEDPFTTEENTSGGQEDASDASAQGGEDEEEASFVPWSSAFILVASVSLGALVARCKPG